MRLTSVQKDREVLPAEVEECKRMITTQTGTEEKLMTDFGRARPAFASKMDFSWLQTKQQKLENEVEQRKERN